MLERVRRVMVPPALPPFRFNKDGGAGTAVLVAGVCPLFSYFTDGYAGTPFPNKDGRTSPLSLFIVRLGMLERVRRVVVPPVLPPFRLNKDGGAGTPVSVAGVCLIFRYFTDMLVPPFPTRMVAPVHYPSL
jgi:hypothetical protein